MSDYQFIVPTVDNENWLAFRKALYHDLNMEFNREEMNLIAVDEDRIVYILYNDEKAIGMLELALRNFVDGCLSSPVAYLEGIYLIPAYQHKGISSIMMDKVKEWAKNNQCTELASDAEIDNEASHQFHKKVGFEETYRVVEYKMKL